MFENKINIYINSKNRPVNEPISKFNVSIPDGLLRLYDKNEYWRLDVNIFSCFNSWFNCMKDFNDKFQLIYHDINGTETERLTFQLTEGNPNVNDIQTNLNNILKNHVAVKYDKIRNEYIYSRVSIRDKFKFKYY